MENTKENKARFFAQYYDQVVLMESEDSSPVFLTGYHLKEVMNGSERFYLELTPLEQISDEDAIKVAKFMGFNWDAKIAKPMIFLLFLIDTNEPLKEEIIIKQMLIKLSDISSTVDLFRDMGYTYEFNGLSVEEQIKRGWVKLKNV